MASTVTNKTMRVAISIKLGDTAVLDRAFSVANINEYDNRIVSVPTSTETELVKFASAVAAGTYIKGNVRALVVINRDDTNFVRLRRKKVYTNRIATLGSITGGSSYTNGTYTAVALTGGTGTGATATIVVSSGAVSSVTIVNKGTGYTVSDSLSAAAANIGGTGSGFSVPVATIDTVSEISDEKIEAGKFVVIGNPSLSVDESNGAFSAFADIESVSVQADTEAVDVEFFIASV